MLEPSWGHGVWPGAGSGPLDIWDRLRHTSSGQYDVVYGFEYQPNVSVPVYLTHSWGRYAFVSDWCDWHAGASNTYRGVRLMHRWDKYWEERIRYRARAVTVISTTLAERAHRIGISSSVIHVVREGVDLDYIRPLPQADARRALGLPLERRVLTMVADGTMHRALHIFRRVADRDATVDLIIVGNIPDDIPAAIRSLGLEGRVRTPGFVEDEDLPRYLASADLCFLPLDDSLANRSRWPHKGNDYMAAGRPFVVNEVGDLGRFVRETGAGMLAPQDDRRFADLLMNLLNDPAASAELGRAARSAAERHLDWRPIGDQLAEIIQGAAERA
jgi:glycosyltransferase involved in cell wall biosynthesis